MTQAPSQQDDAALAVLARGDPSGDAFRTLFERHHAEAHRFLLRLLGAASEADDALQETFGRVYEHLERYDATLPFRPWLYRIARNVAVNALRARKKKGEALPERALDESDVPARAARREAGSDARAALDALEPEVRALLVQRHGLGMKLEELARSFDVTERTIRNRLHAACEQLAAALVARRASGGGR
jgi:RNA polymerase sigma factor (sigma-70 family)